MNKKAISPLLETVLIIGSTVILAWIIIAYGSDFIDKMSGSEKNETISEKRSYFNYTCKELIDRFDEIGSASWQNELEKIKLLNIMELKKCEV